MAEEIRHFTVTIPAGVLASAPVITDISMPFRTVTQVDWRVPHGPMGNLGWQLSMGGVQVLPTAGDTWVLADNEHGSWPLADAPDNGAWQVTGYNTGVHPHSVYLAFHAGPVRRPATAIVELPPFLLMPAPDLSRAGPPVRRRS